MTHDAASGIAALMALAYTTTAAMAPQVPMTDEQVVGVSIGAGLMGGLVATLMSDVAISWRETSKRVLASGMAAPAIVVTILWQANIDARLLGVVAVAGVAGLIAWPIAQALPKLAPKAFRNWIERVFGGGGEKP